MWIEFICAGLVLSAAAILYTQFFIKPIEWPDDVTQKMVERKKERQFYWTEEEQSYDKKTFAVTLSPPMPPPATLDVDPELVLAETPSDEDLERIAEWGIEIPLELRKTQVRKLVPLAEGSAQRTLDQTVCLKKTPVVPVQPVVETTPTYESYGLDHTPGAYSLTRKSQTFAELEAAQADFKKDILELTLEIPAVVYPTSSARRE